ncbi:MAG: hypothetical protein ACI9XB_005422 [Gammaproteobacteria bacterium]|jgi:hypothetical protein
MHTKADKQQSIFFEWFRKIGVSYFDIQLRIPNIECRNGSNWKWLPSYKNISVDHYFTKLYKWTRYMNSQGSDIYIRPHGESENGVLFLDDVSIKKALTISKKYSSCVVCTSKGNTQIWLAIDKKLNKRDRKIAQLYLKDLNFTDPGSISGDHLGRIPGVRSQKRLCWVNILTTSYGAKYSPPISNVISCPKEQACASFNKSTGQSQSELDFGWTLGKLRAGYSVFQTTQWLCENSIKRNKRNPQLYAVRTVRKALTLL